MSRLEYLLSIFTHFEFYVSAVAVAVMSITSIAPSTTASLTATSVTSLLALTTPFVQPPECTSIWSLSSDTLWFHGVHTTLTILSSDQADPRFTSCQPSGWDRVPAANRFTFSPAVCPRGWVYHHMAATESGVENRTADTSRYSTYSTAYCCARYLVIFSVTAAVRP